MIKRVSFLSEFKNFIVELDNPDVSSGLIIRSIDGLGPSKGTVVVRDYASTDGGAFGTSRKEKRNIVLELVFDDRCDVEAVRNSLYGCFKVKREIRTVVKTDRRFAFIDGYVESVEPSIFSSMEGAKVSIICPEPDWILAKQNSPWEIVPKTVQVAVTTTATKVLNEGDIPCGMSVTFTASGDASQPFITVNGLTMRIDQQITSGQSIKIVTNYGSKSCKLIDSSGETNILHKFIRNGEWAELQPGFNDILCGADSGQNLLACTVTFEPRYEGL